MTVDEKMEADHGSTRKALKACIAAGMSNADIGRKYECSGPFIARKLKLSNIENPNNGRSRPRVQEEIILGITNSVSRKAMTAAMISGEELSRIRLLEQVTHIKPGDPQFDAVAADILAQRETCKRQAFTHHLWRE